MGRTGTASDSQCPVKKSVQCATFQQSNRESTVNLPKGLVGSRCTAEVVVSGHTCQCLLDTGSQVTTVSASFYNQYLQDQQINSLHDLLHIEGAAGQSVPYLGYVEMMVQFPKDFIGNEFNVATLALVVPDVRSEAPSTVLIGMNTLEPLYEQYLQSNSPTFQPSLQGYRAVLKTLQLSHWQQDIGHVGVVKLLGKVPVRVPAGRTLIIEGSAKVDSPILSQFVLAQHPVSTLPGGLCVSNCLLTFPAHAPYKVPVVVTNESEQDLYIPSKSVIAELGTYHCILSQHQAKSHLPNHARTTLNFDFGDSPISLEWKERITRRLNDMSEVFSHHDLDFGCTSKVKHHITLHDGMPFKHRARPIHPNDIDAVRRHLSELLEAGVIRESTSPFSSPIVVVRKKNGDVRLCIDYRKLNLQTIKDAYALPNLEESFMALTGSKWFSVLDLKSGYYQIEMHEADKPKTAFVTPLGFWEFNRMPQGVTNAPSTFQRLMERCMGDLHLREVLVFLDDLIIFSNSLEEHERRLIQVLSRLREYGLKLSPEKCKFFQTSVRYLGHIVSERGVETDPEKISVIKSWPIPTNLKELRSFLGFAGYYRRFIKDYSTIVKPLNDLTRGYLPPCKSRTKPSHVQYYNPSQPFGERWSFSCQVAFTTLIEKLTTTPVLGFADPSQPYILHTDASTIGLGAALYQEQEGKLRVIAYASRGLSRSESRYPAHKLEFLALKWSVTEKFQDYLYGATFTVVTDSNPLTYILTSAKLDATGHRWLAALATYSFKLLYRAGKQNLDADALSRRPHQCPDESLKDHEFIQQFLENRLIDSNLISSEVVDAICQSGLVRAAQPVSPGSEGIALVESLSITAKAIPDDYTIENSMPPFLSHLNIKEEQRADAVIRELVYQMETGEKVSPMARAELPELSLLLREWVRLELIDGVLYRNRQDNGNITYQLVLPECLRSVVLKSLHDEMGHMGIERTLDLVRTRFFWPKMAKDVEQKVKTCGRCVRRKTFPERAAPLLNIKTSRPLELICMDFLSLEPDASNTRDILVLTDHFTKFAVAIPTPNQKARTVAKCLWDNFIVCYGIPERLHTDQGRDFESKLIKELCDIAGIKKCRTTPYHPRGNPVERFNRTLLGMLGTLEDKQKSKWKDFVKPLVHAYNCTRNEVTGFTPYELMFGRTPRLPVDLAFGLPLRELQHKTHSQYVQGLRTRLEESFKIASKNALKTAERNRTRFDKKVIPATLEVGDRVLVRNVRLRGKHKLSDKWEQDIYVVVKRAGELPVYTVKPENKDGPLRTLHRDLLLPCNFLPAEDVELSESIHDAKPRTRQQNQNLDDLIDLPASDDYIEDVGSVTFNPSVSRFTVERCFRALDALPASDDAEIFRSPPFDTPVLAVPSVSGSSSEHPESRKEEEVVEEEDVAENLTENLSEPEESTLLPVVPVEPSVAIDIVDNDLTFRRSTRQRAPPERLHYSHLGTPLISVVRSLLHSLSDALNVPPASDI